MIRNIIATRTNSNYSETMRIVQIHSYYRSWIPSGENITVSELSKMLIESNFTISNILGSTDHLLKSKAKRFKALLSLFTASSLTESDSIALVGDEILIIHNEFPIISIRLWRKISSSQIKILRVVHNYRSTCLSGNHWYRENPCFSCQDKNFSMGIIRKCYQKSYAASFIRMLYTKISQFYLKKSDVTYIAISERMSRYISNTFGSDVKIAQIPNSVPDREMINSDAHQVLFVGRLEQEKGLIEIIEIWKDFPHLPILNIVGTGNLKKYADDAAETDSRILVHGAKNSEELELIAKKCKVAVFPTLWREPFGRTMIEALSRGQAVVTTESANAEFCVIEGVNGYVAAIENSDFGNAVAKALTIPLELHTRSSRSFYQSKYTKQIWKENWINTINEVRTLGETIE